MRRSGSKAKFAKRCKTIASPTPSPLKVSSDALEHVPKKLTDFSDQNMLQEIDFERIPIDRMIPSDRNTL
jgi:hypothetical protein